ncbi:hypothetical protein J0X19_22915 [Hymenobacter sp. BT186]|uniref:Metallo-beta-lactamase domain-containing protein n=1 Tax=Hymenobacter telluris TaxID=2816474 RepID=A0A939F0Y4_9BACT|nr:MBL fold metallo-hydrolase [Hymenobacter telluris]MBO0360829.1 hypothetical protein [Hymenobacter telluris]MBW3376858.1 hypothetical protein [Hymenobacter norwichensis]
MTQPLIITLLPAEDGDCLLLSLGTEAHILIDAGRSSTYTGYLRPLLLTQATNRQPLNCCIITHIDADHITGAVNGLFAENGDANSPRLIPIQQVWHNSYRHLFSTLESMVDTLSVADQTVLQQIIARGKITLASGPALEAHPISARQGTMLGTLLLRHGYAWNTDAGQEAIKVPLVAEVAPGIVLKVLSPSLTGLQNLERRWRRTLRAMGFSSQLHSGAPFDDAYEWWLLTEKSDLSALPRLIGAPSSLTAHLNTQFREDTSSANGSSIALVLEADGRRVLLLGDSHPSVVMHELECHYANEPRPWWFDCIKLSHHGSFANNSPDLLQATDSDCYLFSTNGRHGHPDAATIAWVVTRPISRTGQIRRLGCNYETPTMRQFARADWQTQYHYQIEVAPTGQPLIVSL